MGSGVHGVNGLNPKIAFHIFKIYITLHLLYGLDSLVVPKAQIAELEKYHISFLRAIQGQP